MSLKIWFPFNGNLTSNGIQNPTITNIITPGFSTGGKIGNCWTSGEIAIDSATTAASFADNNTSVAFWFNNNGSMTGDCAICGTSGNGYGGSTRTWDFFNYPSKNDFHWSMTDMGSGVLYGVLADNVWNHIAITKDSTTLRIYINGVLQHTASSSNPGYSYAVNYYIGASGTNYKLNDFRVYNHCLSMAEIKELNKGLVVHYPLNSGYAEPTTNLYNTLSWTCYNGSLGTYGYGTSTDMYREDGIFNGLQCTKVHMGTAGNACWPFLFFECIHPGNGAYKTLSFDYYTTNMSDVNFYSYNGSANVTYRVNGASGSGGTFSVKVGQWNHIEFTLYGTSTAESGWGYMRIGANGGHTSTLTDYWLVANINTEAKDHATPYTPSSRAETAVYDVSGNKFNGIIAAASSPICVAGSPRYDKCYLFDTSKFITSPTINCSGFANNYTFSWWANLPSWDGKMCWGFGNGNILNYYCGLYWNVGDGGENPFYTPGTTSMINAPSNNTWHHIAITGDGSTTKLYLDGVHYGTAKTYRALTGDWFKINGWGADTGYRTSGKLSDFRLYSTCFSLADIQDLYNAPIKISSNGKLITNGEVIE